MHLTKLGKSNEKVIY